MAISGGELAAVLDELRSALIGLHVKKIYHPSAADLVFTFRENVGARLLVSVHPRFGRMHLLSKGAEKLPETPSPFALQLRKHLVGLSVEGFDKEPGGRLARIRFPEIFLYCRFYSPAGYVLADGEGTVIGVIGGGTESPLKPGMAFHFPHTDGNPEEEKAVFEGSPSGHLETIYNKRMDEARFDEEKTGLLVSARAERKRLLKLIDALEGDRKKLEYYAQYRKWGDICRTWFGELKRGMAQITLADPETGEPVTIPLSPELGPTENLDLLYKRHRKYRTGTEKIVAAIGEARRKAEDAEQRIIALEKATSADELAAHKVVGREPGKKKQGKGKKGSEVSGFRSFISADGLEMLVGRNDRQNDDLIRKSRGNDLWFHVRDFPGSHVVVRMMKKTDVPSGTIAEAARLALKYSTRARDMKGTVVYTHVKYLKKPKGAPPGKVLVTREKTIHVSLD